MFSLKNLLKNSEIIFSHVPSQFYIRNAQPLHKIFLQHLFVSRQNVTSVGCNFKSLLSSNAALHQDVSHDLTSTAMPGENANGKRQKYQKWYQTSREFKIVSSIVIALGSYLLSSHYEKKRAIKEIKLQLVNEQIKLLYGPLYGNRLVQEKTYRVVMGEYGGLKRYLRKAEETRDAEMIKRWRNFVWNVLYPLDKEAEDLICQNSHLIADCDFPVAFEHFLNHIAKLKFVMERHWKTEDGKLEPMKDFTPDDYLEENNASGDRGVKEMLEHVKEKYKELRDLQKKLKIRQTAPVPLDLVSGLYANYQQMDDT